MFSILISSNFLLNETSKDWQWFLPTSWRKPLQPIVINYPRIRIVKLSNCQDLMILLSRIRYNTWAVVKTWYYEQLCLSIALFSLYTYKSLSIFYLHMASTWLSTNVFYQFIGFYTWTTCLVHSEVKIYSGSAIIFYFCFTFI